MNPHRLKAYFLLLIVAAIWGAAVPIIKFTLGGIQPLPFLAYRFSISAVFSIAYFSIKGVKLPKPSSSLPLIFIYGLLAFTIALGALFTGLEKSTVLDLTLIGAIGPLVVALGGLVFFKDRITHREKLGISIVVFGAFINAFSSIFTNNSNARITGNLFIIAFLLADSGAVLFAKRIVQKKIPPLTLTNLGFIVGALTLIPFAIYVHGGETIINLITNLPLKYHFGVWYMALLSGSLAYFLYVRAYKSIEVSEATLFNYLQPIFAVPLAIFWLGEKITFPFIIGAILITSGVVIAEFKKKG